MYILSSNVRFRCGNMSMYTPVCDIGQCFVIVTMFCLDYVLLLEKLHTMNANYYYYYLYEKHPLRNPVLNVCFIVAMNRKERLSQGC